MFCLFLNTCNTPLTFIISADLRCGGDLTPCSYPPPAIECFSLLPDSDLVVAAGKGLLLYADLWAQPHGEESRRISQHFFPPGQLNYAHVAVPVFAEYSLILLHGKQTLIGHRYRILGPQWSSSPRPTIERFFFCSFPTDSGSFLCLKGKGFCAPSWSFRFLFHRREMSKGKQVA